MSNTLINHVITLYIYVGLEGHALFEGDELRWHETVKYQRASDLVRKWMTRRICCVGHQWASQRWFAAGRGRGSFLRTSKEEESRL